MLRFGRYVSRAVGGAGFVLAGSAAMPASAAEISPAPVYKTAAVHNWTGVYIGVHQGYALSGGQPVQVSSLPSPVATGQADFDVRFDSKGFLGGGQAGYNWQVSPTWVVGVEADLSYSSVKGKARFTEITSFGVPAPPGSFQDVSEKLNWLGTLRARTGFLANDRTLLFVTAGLALGSVKYSGFQDLGDPMFQYAGAVTKTKLGWSIGGGGEWAMSSNWSAKVEYLYYDLGDETIVQDRVAVIPNDPFKIVSTFETKGHILRAGLNYRFGATSEAGY
jgi:outer membrane immunogenic protein